MSLLGGIGTALDDLWLPTFEEDSSDVAERDLNSTDCKEAFSLALGMFPELSFLRKKQECGFTAELILFQIVYLQSGCSPLVNNYKDTFKLSIIKATFQI